MSEIACIHKKKIELIFLLKKAEKVILAVGTKTL